MTANNECMPIDDEDQPLSHWEDFKQRLIESLWHDYFKRNTVIASTAIVVFGLLWGVFFE